jgi:hypothetical protein
MRIAVLIPRDLVLPTALIVALVGVLAPATHAEETIVYKCPRADGSVGYSKDPCPDGEEMRVEGGKGPPPEGQYSAWERYPEGSVSFDSARVCVDMYRPGARDPEDVKTVHAVFMTDGRQKDIVVEARETDAKGNPSVVYFVCTIDKKTDSMIGMDQARADRVKAVGLEGAYEVRRKK